MFQVNNYSLKLQGLQVSYEKDAETHNVCYEPLPACELFKRIGVINDFSEDHNGEPIVKLNHIDRQYWYEFVKLFKIDTQLPMKIAQYHNRNMPVELM